MWVDIKKHPRAFIAAIAVHLVAIFFLVAGLEWKQEIKPAGGPPIIKAVAVDQKRVDKELKRLKEDEQAKQRAAKKEAERLKQLQREVEETKQKKAAEKKRLAELSKKREAEKKKLAAQKLETERVAKLEKTRLAKLQKERAEAEEQRKAEAKRLAELEAKRKLEQEKQREAEAAKKKAAAEKREREAEARRRQEELAAEQRRMEAEANERRAQSETARYISLIKAKVERNWLRPPVAATGLKCTVRVRLIPGGDVVSAVVVRSSGNAVFDRSVETAVLRAAPLPIPGDAMLFERFREIDFEFDPKDT
jgi:colicin import membrane protein